MNLKHKQYFFYPPLTAIRNQVTMETCFHLSTIASTVTPHTTKAACLHKDKLAAKRPISSLSISSASSAFKSFPSTGLRGRASRIVCDAKNAVAEVAAVDEASWDNLVIGNETPVVVYFWAPWCGPCRMIAPVMSELAKEYVGKITCYKVNTDDCPNIASGQGIRSIPTVLVFKNGEKKESIIGAVQKSSLIATIEKYI